MSTVATPVKKEQANSTSPDIKKGVENHKAAAKHHEEATKNHHQAAKHHEDGNHEKAAQSTIITNGHSSLAHDAQKDDAKSHVTSVKK